MCVSSQIRVALIGGGDVFHKHLAALRALPTRFQLVGICDTSAAKRTAMEAETGIKAHRCLRDCLDSSAPDLVILATPSGIHAEQTQMAAKRGVHVLTEKPMAITLSDAHDMLTTCERHGVHLFSCRQLRQKPAYAQLKRALDLGLFGSIYNVRLEMIWNRNAAYYSRNAWRGTRSGDGGMLLNQGIHYMDLMTWFLGPISRIFAETATLGRDIETEDSALLNWSWPSGTLGSATITVLGDPKSTRTSVEILGEHGSALVCDGAQTVRNWSVSPPPVPRSNELDLAPGTHSSYLLSVANALDGRPSEAVSGHLALPALEMVFSAYRSAELGRAVDVGRPSCHELESPQKEPNHVGQINSDQSDPM
jgi:UDP-N-acetyl-2-amino-2-deoxyglucuronate dehydrogenase